ncbi:MAG: hypothetical protein OEV00_06025 [Acidobacteriota bacterium]|nr:hypothetical protein [Acidobacteriota bacterium]MDH3784871.1 hypothetical protein [Acidobacteriota bacterium]
MQRDTPEALELAEQRGMDVRSGTCAVMYLTSGITYNAVHKWIMKLVDKY